MAPVLLAQSRVAAGLVNDHDTIVWLSRGGDELARAAAEVEDHELRTVDAAGVQEAADFFGEHRNVV
jgi:hypothetical protein